MCALPLVQGEQRSSDGGHRSTGIFLGAGKVGDGLGNLRVQVIQELRSFVIFVANDDRNERTASPITWAALSVVQCPNNCAAAKSVADMAEVVSSPPPGAHIVTHLRVAL